MIMLKELFTLGTKSLADNTNITQPRTKSRSFLMMLLCFAVLSVSATAKAQKPLPSSELETPLSDTDLPSNSQLRDAVQDVFERIWVPSSRLTDGPHVRTIFRPVIEEARQATVQIRCNRTRVALGGVVGPDGWVLTKASRLDGPVTCRLIDGRELDARIVGIDSEYDLAMLKIDAKQLTYFNLTEPKEVAKQASDISKAISSSADTEDGDWIATVGASLNPVAVGVVSVGPRSIPRRPGFLGIARDEAHEVSKAVGVKISDVTEKSGADKAGMQPGDIIIQIDSQPIEGMPKLQQIIQSHYPGDRISVVINRGEQELTLSAVLADWAPSNAMAMRASYQNNLGSVLSIRRAGFRGVLQHDTVLKPRDCGGPLVDLDGELVGFNIARAGRTESYALPSELVRSRLFDLMSGSLTPSSVGN